MFIKLREDTEKRLIQAEENINELKNNKESKQIIEKLLSLNPQFLYGIFNPIIKSFDSIENIEHNYGVLVQHIFDDIQIYLTEDIHPIERNMKDRLNENLIKQGKEPLPYTTYLKANLREEGKCCDILQYIDQMEKEKIRGINIQCDIDRKRNIPLTATSGLKKIIEGFNQSNLDLIDSELKGFLNNDKF